MSQPVEYYPNTVTRLSSSNPNGSFGPVFIVLAIIFVLSAVACVLGRLCSKRLYDVAKEHHRAAKEHHQVKAKQTSHQPLGPKQWEAKQKASFNMRDADIEFGVHDKRIPNVTPKMGGINGNSRGPKPYDINGNSRAPKPYDINGNSRGPKPYDINGGSGRFKGEVRFADNCVDFKGKA